MKEKRDEKRFDDDKSVLFMSSGNSDQSCGSLLTDLYKLRQLFGKKINIQRPVLPGAPTDQMVAMISRHDCELFFTCVSSKSHRTLMLGRIFNRSIFDWYRMDVNEYLTMDHFKASRSGLPLLGTKPLVVFNGPVFSADTESVKYPGIALQSGVSNASFLGLKNALLDVFSAPNVDSLAERSVDCVVSVTQLPTSGDSKPQLRISVFKLDRDSDSNASSGSLSEIGPRITVTLRDAKLASPETLQAATTRKKHRIQTSHEQSVLPGNGERPSAPIVNRKKKSKSLKYDKTLQRTTGNVYVQKTQLSKLYSVHGKRR